MDKEDKNKELTDEEIEEILKQQMGKHYLPPEEREKRNRELQEWLKRELGDKYIEPDELFKLGKYIDIGIYDEEGKLIGLKEDEDEDFWD